MISIFNQTKEISADSLFNLLPINFSWFDTKGYILGCNQRVIDMFNIDIIGKHLKAQFEMIVLNRNIDVDVSGAVAISGNILAATPPAVVG